VAGALNDTFTAPVTVTVQVPLGKTSADTGFAFGWVAA
jgi:hypothetical protein